MKPILYESTETLFQSNGLGLLADCISFHVLEERNGQYEAEFEYPVDGIHYSDIIEGRIVFASHDESGDLQPFDIYGHSKTVNGVTTFYAHHIAYRQNGITVKPFTATSLSQTLTKIKSNSVNTNPFNYSTDKTVSASFQLTSPKPLRSILGGEEGSLLDVYGTGEYEWDRFQVILHLHRGTDSGVVVRYGKNLISLQDDIDYSDSYNGIVPFWYGQNTPADGEEAVETLVTLSEWVIYKTGSTYDGRNTVIPVDFSSQFQTIPTEAQLRTAAQSYLDRGNPLLPTDTLTFDFVELSKTEEYSYMALQQVNLCDTVKVIYDDIDTTMKVISVDWDVLNERYRSLTLGDAPATYAQVITDRLATIAENANEGARLAKLWATNALSIAGNTDQYFWFTGTGTDTGAHITEVPKNTFLADPTHGGGNLIARSNGIAARNGLTELATFGANGSRVGVSGSAAVTTQTDGIRLYDGAGNNCAFFGVDGNNPSIRIGNADQRGHIRITPTSGVRFLREDDSTPMAQLASDGLQIWANDGTNNTSVAFYGAQCRVGPIADKNVYIGNGAINFRDNGTSLGEFTGTTARIGKADSSHVEIGATNGMNIFDQNNKLRLNASSTGISIFDYSSSSSTTPINVAQFNTTVRVGAVANSQSRVLIQPSGIDFISRNSSGTDVNLAHIGYANGAAQSGTAVAPYYTFGTRATGTIGNYSTVEGYGNIASGYCSHAEGNEAIASGHYSHAEGILLSTPSMPSGVHPTASGYASHTEGGATTASGNYSHAEGQITVASNTGSHAEGSGATASGAYSHAEGWDSVASGIGSHAGGKSTIAQGRAQTAIGMFNIAQGTADSYVLSDYAFIIGNGTGASARSNALTVDWSGNVNIASGAHYKINGTNLSASDVGAVRNSYGSLTNVFPQGFTNADSIKVGITGSVKATPTATEDTQYLFGARAIAPVLYNDTTGTTIWTGYTTLNKPSASDVGALPIGGGTLTGDLTVNGKIQGLYRITSTTVAPGAIGANSAKAAANYDITNYSTYINAGYEPVAISGDATDNTAIKAFARIYDDSGTKKIRATFRNYSSSSVTTNYYFYILWLKGTSA